jgi:hypothetical protein
MSKNLTNTQKHTHIIVTNWLRSLSISRSPTVIAAVASVIAAVAAVIVVAAVVTVGAAVVKEEVAAGSPLDHGKVLELLSQPVDPEGETLHACVLVHIMMRLNVEGLANNFKLSEGAPEQLDGKLSVVEERFLVGILGRC